VEGDITPLELAKAIAPFPEDLIELLDQVCPSPAVVDAAVGVIGGD
jgi:hypothetical protein